MSTKPFAFTITSNGQVYIKSSMQKIFNLVEMLGVQLSNVKIFAVYDETSIAKEIPSDLYLHPIFRYNGLSEAKKAIEETFQIVNALSEQGNDKTYEVNDIDAEHFRIIADTISRKKIACIKALRKAAYQVKTLPLDEIERNIALHL